MHSKLLFALDIPGGAATAIIAVVGIIIVVFINLAIWASRYTKVGPNQVLIVSGRQNRYVDSDGSVRTIGFRVVKGGGTFVWPVIERVDALSLEVLTVNVKTPEISTSHGVPLLVDGAAQVKIKGDDISIAKAAEHFLSKGSEAISTVVAQILERHLRTIMEQKAVEEILQNRGLLATRVQEPATRDLAGMGLDILNFTIRDIRKANAPK